MVFLHPKSKYSVMLNSGPITFIVTPVNTTLKSGDDVAFHCSATGYPQPTIQWYYTNGTKVSVVS